MSNLHRTITKTTNPTINDDITNGIEVGYHWVNSTSGNMFICSDNTDGAAVWDIISVLTLSQTITIPLRAVVDTSIRLLGERRTVASAQTGDYATDFAVDNQHVSILVNTIVTGGDIVITGDSINETTGVVTAGDTETITVDTTAAQHYQTSKKWWVITNIDITTGAIVDITYDILVVGYTDIGNSDYKIVGYRLDAFSQGVSPDFNFALIKVQDDGSGKMSFVELENIGVDSNSAGDQIIDSLRTAGNDRSYDSVLAELWGDDTNLTFKQGDFDTYFSSNENHFLSSSNDEGYFVEIEGSPSGAITNVDYITLRIDYQLITS